jgi:nitrile hydratase subunit beta
MNGVHDLGGMHGFGPVLREEDEPRFHAEWEKHVLVMQRGTIGQGIFNLDEFRDGIERMDPIHYLAATYYERWLATLETNLVEKGIITREELDARTASFADHPHATLSQRDGPGIRHRINQAEVPEGEVAGTSPRFAIGDPVTTRIMHPTGHTRLPRYARGKRGVIDRVHGLEILPDTHTRGRPAQMEAVYSVRFSGEELWGDAAEPHETLNIDLWESYLSPA